MTKRLACLVALLAALSSPVHASPKVKLVGTVQAVTYFHLGGPLLPAPIGGCVVGVKDSSGPDTYPVWYYNAGGVLCPRVGQHVSVEAVLSEAYCVEDECFHGQLVLIATQVQAR